MLNTSRFAIYFGGQATSYIDDSLHGKSQQEIKNLPGYKDFCDKNGCEQVVLLEQVHGNSGYSVFEKKDTAIRPYSVNADYSVTTLPKVALVIETADCSPVVLVDPVVGVVAIVHAGWRGAVGGVVQNAVTGMRACGSALENITVYFGPAARGCCYEVSPDFPVVSLDTISLRKSLGKSGEAQLYFDNISFIKEQLLKIGVLEKNILSDYAVCTICSPDYCSFRRQGKLNLRQMSIVALK